MASVQRNQPGRAAGLRAGPTGGNWASPGGCAGPHRRGESQSASQPYFGLNHKLVCCLVVTTQIAVRLPDDMVAFLDRLVATGRATSRASAIERALAREIRRDIAARDAAILAGTEPDEDMDSLAGYVAGLRPDVE